MNGETNIKLCLDVCKLCWKFCLEVGCKVELTEDLPASWRVRYRNKTFWSQDWAVLSSLHGVMSLVKNQTR
jgi:hypothetical protein